MLTKTNGDNNESTKKHQYHPDRTYFSFYTPRFQKVQIIALVNKGLGTNPTDFIKKGLITRIEKYIHLINDTDMKKAEKQLQKLEAKIEAKRSSNSEEE
jgi:hypothetical protein